MVRYIGIQHRRKRTTEGEARPTRIVIIEDDKVRQLELEDDTAEKDFMLGRYPVSYRKMEPDDSLDGLPVHHVKWKKLKDGDQGDITSTHLLHREGKTLLVADKMPDVYDGLMEGDIVGMVLGGSGDRLAAAISRRGEEIGATAWRIPTYRLKALREEAGSDKEADAKLLAELVRDQRYEFYQVTPRERELIRLTEAFRARTDAMRARIGCEQRLLQRIVGKIFLSEDGRYPEGAIEDLYDAEKASDKILQAMLKEEKARESEVAGILKNMPVYTDLLAAVEGVGPMIAARLIVAIRDIRRFKTDAKLKAYLGAHVMNGGRFGDRPADKQFARRRGGEVANWHADGRQSLYLVADQFNRRPDSEWGKRLRANKALLRERHPEVVENEEGKKRYTDGHIHKMALWRTATQFVRWLFRQWWALERQGEVSLKAAAQQ